jgi:septal ring factor EnvC (AmiA/AmiB activator)
VVASLVAIATIASADQATWDPRATITHQLAAEADAIARARATVGDKLVDADTVRLARLRAAYRLLRAPLRSGASPADRLAAARRRAGARMLVDRDAAERRLLVEETGLLHGAAERTVVATGAIPTVTLPTDLARPARGTIVRRFGTLLHERSKAMLSRRGIDLEVEPRAVASAPADGTVRYAGPIRGLDDGVIIEHGDYFTVIAKLGDLVVPIGAPVRRGDRLGRAARQRIYMEVRVRIGPGGVPIDPEPLLAKTR